MLTAEDFQRLWAAVGKRRPHPPPSCHQFQDPSINSLVIHDQNAEARQRHEGGFVAARGPDLLAKIYLKPETAPLPNLARHPERPSHHLNETFANDKPQTSPSIFPRGRPISLAERLKEPFTAFFRNPDSGVRDRYTNARLLL